MQDYTADEVLARIIVCDGSIDEDGGEDILQSINVDTVEIVDSIVCPRRAGIPIIGNVSLGKEIDNVGGRIDNRGADDANSIGDIGTAYV